MQAPRYFVFDMDRTLVRSEHLADSWVTACATAGITKQQALDGLTNFMGVPARQLAEKLGCNNQKQLDVLVEVFVNACDTAAPVPVEHADALLRRLKASGHKLYLSTGSSSKAVENVLSACNWHGIFDLALGSEPGFLKGQDHWQAIVDHSNLDAHTFAQQTATIGDGAGDMKHGVAWNIRHRIAFLFDHDPGAAAMIDAGATALVHNLNEINF